MIAKDEHFQEPTDHLLLSCIGMSCPVTVRGG